MEADFVVRIFCENALGYPRVTINTTVIVIVITGAFTDVKNNRLIWNIVFDQSTNSD